MAESPGSSSDEEKLIGKCCKSDAFEEESVREIFLSKVFGLFFGHLMAALGIVLLVSESEAFQFYMAARPNLIWASVASPIVLLLVYHYFTDARRTCPLDYLALAVFTVSLGVSCGMMAAVTGTVDAGVCLGILAAIFLVLATYAMLAKCDVSLVSTSAVAAAVALLVTALAAVFKPDLFKTVGKMAGVAFVDAVFVVYVTDAMVMPGYVYELCPEEYAFATMNIYVDVIRFFAAVWNTMMDPGMIKNQACEIYVAMRTGADSFSLRALTHAQPRLTRVDASVYSDSAEQSELFQWTSFPEGRSNPGNVIQTLINMCSNLKGLGVHISE
ncbi:unnamed protein product [Notodromas monacha]|uniref:Uncharacterized protein n=1 Tax=Notodromas monacha TaxID=399045 RepID=A0A7R9BE08_9CRUS|nr:unnamed protein product [Notodromas monacha]CAG0912422.1 unnamed protein product [Notodromas monacha]